MAKRLLVSILGLSLGLVACATSNDKGTVAEQAAPTAAPERALAAAQTIEYTTDTRELPKVCGHAPESRVNVPPLQVILTSKQEAVSRYIVRTPTYDCETTVGDGSGGNWAGFYDRSGDKGEMLNQAIKGVGKTTAPLLVPYFQQGKPRSWREFSNVILSAARTIERNTGLNPSWTSNVLKQHKEANMRNLGYLGSTGCSVTGYSDEHYEERQFLRNISIVVEARIRGGKLLPGECDNFWVSFNGREVSGRTESDTNAYSLSVNYDQLTANVSSGRKAIASFSGTRRAVAPGYFIEVAGSSAVESNGTIQLTIQHSALNQMMRVPEFANACKLSAHVQLFAKKGSSWAAKKSKLLKAMSIPLDGAKISTSAMVDGIAMGEGHRPAVDVRTSFGPGCPFFSTAVITNGQID